jgi:hypothetical protein
MTDSKRELVIYQTEDGKSRVRSQRQAGFGRVGH